MRTVQLTQGSEDWLTWRRKGVGGSEVACVVGSNPYRDSQADRIWSRKLPPDHPEAAPETKDNSFMAHGRRYEPEARSLYEALFGWKVEPVCVLHDSMDCARASLDGWNEELKLVWECKCPQSKNHQKYIGISQIADPLERQTEFCRSFSYYRSQVLYQMALCNAEQCHFVSYKPDYSVVEDRLVLIPLYPEPDEQELILNRVKEFWELVESRTCPSDEWMQPVWNWPTKLRISNGQDQQTAITHQ